MSPFLLILLPVLAQPESNNCRYPFGPCQSSSFSTTNDGGATFSSVTVTGTTGQIVCSSTTAQCFHVSDMAAGSMGAGAFVFNTLNAGTGGDTIMSWQTGGSQKAFLDRQGNLQISAGLTATTGTFSGVVHLSTAAPALDNNANNTTLTIRTGASNGFAADNYAFQVNTSNFGPGAGASGNFMTFYGNNGSMKLFAWDAHGQPTLYVNAPRRQGSYQVNLSADTTFTALGLPAATTTPAAGTCTPAADVASDTAYQMIKFPTDAVSSGDACGVFGPFTTAIAPSYLPLFYAVVHTDSANVTSTRTYAGLSKSRLDNQNGLVGGNNGCFFGFDTAASGMGSNVDWVACSSDGTTETCTDTTIAYAANTTYVLLVDNSVSGECDYYNNGVKNVAKSSNITTSSQALGIDVSITTLTTAARNLSIAKIIEQEN